MAERKTITVYEDDLKFILKEWREFLGEYDTFTRRRFNVAASVTRLEGMMGIISDPDKTPVRPAFASRKMTEPGGYQVGKKGNNDDK